MLQKNVKYKIKSKFNDFLESIENKKIKKLIEKNSIITGGAISSLILNEKVKDYDLYFTNKSTVEKVANYFLNKFIENNSGASDCSVVTENGRIKINIPSSGILKNKSEDEEKKYIPLCITDNAITLSDDIQIIIRFYGNAEEIHKNFDFVHARGYWISKTNELKISYETLNSLINKELIYEGSLYPVASLFRIRKFIRRGWNVSAAQILKIAFQISLLDLTDINILKDQLIGVDVAYLNEVINKINMDMKENPKLKIDNTYFCRIIDEIFEDKLIDEYDEDD